MSNRTRGLFDFVSSTSSDGPTSLFNSPSPEVTDRIATLSNWQPPALLRTPATHDSPEHRLLSEIYFRPQRFHWDDVQHKISHQIAATGTDRLKLRICDAFLNVLLWVKDRQGNISRDHHAQRLVEFIQRPARRDDLRQHLDAALEIEDARSTDVCINFQVMFSYYSSEHATFQSRVQVQQDDSDGETTLTFPLTDRIRRSESVSLTESFPGIPAFAVLASWRQHILPRTMPILQDRVNPEDRIKFLPGIDSIQCPICKERYHDGQEKEQPLRLHVS